MEFLICLTLTILGAFGIFFRDGGQGVAFITSLAMTLYLVSAPIRKTYLKELGVVLLIINSMFLVCSTLYIFYGIDLFTKLMLR